MTTDRAPKLARRAPVGLSGLEWKLGLTAVLAASYTASWLVLADAVPSAPAQASVGPRRAKTATTVARAPRSSGAGRVRTRSS